MGIKINTFCAFIPMYGSWERTRGSGHTVGDIWLLVLSWVIVSAVKYMYTYMYVSNPV